MIFLNNGRIRLSGDTTYYVSTTGSDATGDGSAAHPWATPQFAADFISRNLDFNGHNVIVQLADGTYTSGFNVAGPIPGQGNAASLLLRGNTGNNDAVFLDLAAGFPLLATTGGKFKATNLKLRTAGDYCIYSLAGAIDFNNIDFVSAAVSHLYAFRNGFINISGNYSISGSAPSHMKANQAGNIQTVGATITITGTPAFSLAFAYATTVGQVVALSNTFSGSATGPRYLADGNGVVLTGGAPTYLPGDVAGSTASGGQYT